MNLSDISIAIFGCKDTTEALLREFPEAALVTITDGCANRNGVAGYKNLIAECLSGAASRDMFLTGDYTLKSDGSYFEEKKFDIGFCLGWQRLIPEQILKTFRFGVYGMHGSAFDLPIGRGRSPMNWALIEGRKSFYTNLFKYNPGVDDGDIVAKYKFEITERDTAKTMHIKNTMAMVTLVKNNIERLVSEKSALIPQKDLRPTFYPKRNYSDNLIDWEMYVHNIDAHIRAVVDPFGNAYSFINDTKIVIKRSQVMKDEFGHEDKKIGEVVNIISDCPVVKCFGGLLLIEEYEGFVSIGNVFWSNGQKKSDFSMNFKGGYDK